MNRLEESESTPKKRNLRDETVVKEAITKSGRKVKRPAHLDSPERTPSASPSETRKSVAVRVKKATEPYAVTPSKRTATKEKHSPEEVKGSRKTITASSKTISEHSDTPKRNKEKRQMSSAVDDATGISKSGRKIKIPAKLIEFESDVLNSPRKNNDQNEPAKDKLAKTPSRSKATASLTVEQQPDEQEGKSPAVRKTPGRRAKSVAPDPLEVNTVRTPKRRGVTSLFSKEIPAESASSEPTHSKTPGKRITKTLLGVDVKASPKTPRSRARSVAPVKEVKDEIQLAQNDSESASKAYENTTKTASRRVGKTVVQPTGNERSDTVLDVPKTPGRRVAKSMINASAVTTLDIESTEAKSQSPKTTARRHKSIAVGKAQMVNTDIESVVEANGSAKDGKITAALEEPLTRSGRKIKPKKVFDFEHDEKSTEQEKISIEGRRKRKVDNTDESMKSPTKKKMIEHAEAQTPKLKGQPESNMSVLDASEVSVSRSGRKIKPKKMFGFAEDGETTTNIVHITGSSPSKEATSSSSIVELKSSPRAMAIVQNMEELIEDPETDQKKTYTPSELKKQQHLIDETDRAIVSSEPVIIRTSIGFGKPTARKPMALPEETGKAEGDDCTKSTANITPPRTDVQTIGSSRSGRKIKPKKFFDTDDELAAVSPQSILTTKANESVQLPSVQSPKQQVIEEQESEHLNITAPIHNVVADKVLNSAEGIDIPEGPVKFVTDATVGNPGDDGIEDQSKHQIKSDEPQKDTESDHSDVVMTPEEDLDVMKEKETLETIDEKLNTAKEVIVAEQVEEKVDIPEKQQMLPEENNFENIRKSEGSETIPLHSEEDEIMKGSSFDVSDIKKSPLVEDSSVKNIESPLALADNPEEESFGSIEYLEDEMNNIVEHIKKPSHQSKDSSAENGNSASAIPTIVFIPETPAQNVLNETYSPAKHNSSIIDITADTPCPVVAAAAPRTPDTKLTERDANDKCSPDKPPEVIEIMDSPAVAAFCKQINEETVNGANGGSATSTPLAVRPLVQQPVNECVNNEPLNVQYESRKRSLSTSAVDTTIKRNVTFHSPANCTMLVETIDERLMLKSLQDQQQQRLETMEKQETSSKSIGEKLRKPRKRSLSEHKPSEMKRNKSSKLPNFKSIHAKHFDRMESLAEFMKRKETRAKQIHSACSPATKLLAQPVSSGSGAAGVSLVEKKIPSSSTKPFIFKSAGGGIPVPSAGLFVKRTKEGQAATIAAPSIEKKPIASDRERMVNRLKQFQATFKPKQISTDTSAVPVSGSLASTTTTTVAGERPIELMRSKQSKILKGVRTNRRFELQMKHRDNLQHQ
uniref:Uncharacterized protein n=1 Tax=Anopheles culicifacies TaxID=139723 RepID=A0A182MW93_9DIPT